MQVVQKISYGKKGISVYRVHAERESSARLRRSTRPTADRAIFAAEVDVEVFDDEFLSSYETGDNSNVVATDRMKNLVLREAAGFTGATLEQFLAYLGCRFLCEYPQMRSLRHSEREQPFTPAVREAPRECCVGSPVLFRTSPKEFTVASLELRKNTNSFTVISHESGQIRLRLIKIVVN